jgi:hypothetical protein
MPGVAFGRNGTSSFNEDVSEQKSAILNTICSENEFQNLKVDFHSIPWEKNAVSGDLSWLQF